MKFTPGPGLGGHCIPIDPLYLSWKLRSLKYTARFIDLASEINSNMPRYVVTMTQDALNDHQKSIKGSRILILGAAYKADIDDLRESPALDVINLLVEKGAIVDYHDPYVSRIREEGEDRISVTDVMAAVRQADCVVIITNHSIYDYKAIQQQSKLVVDTRNAIGSGYPNVYLL
jgi:UDP-N-acetyl-D-glucosamine dehydrogenase